MFEEFDALSFDCYGTLIDWEAGIASVLGPWGRRTRSALTDEQLLAAYALEEARIEREHPTVLYPEVLAMVLRSLGERLAVPVTEADALRFAASVPAWPAFADSHAALEQLAARFKLIILSNVDRASFEGSRNSLNVPFHHVITAEDVGSYKPAEKNFTVLKAYADAHGLRLLHVAQSLFHDHVPAAKAGLPAVWINRRRGRPGWGATPEAGTSPLPKWTFESMAEFAAAARA